MLAWEEHQMNLFRSGIEYAIERNSENLRFGEEFTMDEFIAECMESLNLEGDPIDEERKFDDLVCDTAYYNECWVDDDECEDDDDEI